VLQHDPSMLLNTQIEKCPTNGLAGPPSKLFGDLLQPPRRGGGGVALTKDLDGGLLGGGDCKRGH
jgi:hypothetical protein